MFFDKANYLVVNSENPCPSCDHNEWTPYIYALGRPEPFPVERWMLECPRYDRSEDLAITFKPLIDKVSEGCAEGSEVELCRTCGCIFVFRNGELEIDEEITGNVDPLYGKNSIWVVDETKLATPGLRVVKL